MMEKYQSVNQRVKIKIEKIFVFTWNFIYLCAYKTSKTNFFNYLKETIKNKNIRNHVNE
jgi:hypothetical protein